VDKPSLSELLNWSRSERITRRLLAVAVFCLVAATFLPVIHNTLVNWDDEDYFVTNQHYRGLSLDNLRWCFTTYYMGHYQPLNWLSYAVDYSISGMKDLHVRLHQTQVLLHAITSVLVMYLGYVLLKIVRPDRDATSAAVGAAAGALFFALHPLRVESVAWSSARSDLIATPFFVLAVVSYLTAHRSDRAAPRSWVHRLGPSFGLYILALLGKEFAVTLPAVLILLDVYPLRRLELGRIREWADARHRFVLLEKLPFFAVAIVAVINAFAAAGSEAVASIEQHSPASRIAQVCVSLVWYPFKTLAPSGLTPLYEFPNGFGPGHPLAIRSVIALALVLCVLYLVRRRAKGLIAAAVCYAILILPVSGLTQRGPQITADRYTYLGCLPWAMLFAYLFLVAFERYRLRATVVAGVLFAMMIVGTREQISVWRDSYTLWSHGVAVDDTSGGAHAHLGHALHWEGRLDDAIREYRKGLELGWKHTNVHRNLAAIFNQLYRNEEAVAEYLKDIRLYPGRWESHYYLAVTYERMDEDEKAKEQYLAALDMNPEWADAHVAMGRLLMKHGYDELAEARLRHALTLKPQQREALERLALLCAESGRLPEAIELVDLCLKAAMEVGDKRAVEGLQNRRAEYEAMATTQPANQAR
jgi:Tfp pilus assembly protein PilF